jgi:hypothetical protein
MVWGGHVPADASDRSYHWEICDSSHTQPHGHVATLHLSDSLTVAALGGRAAPLPAMISQQPADCQ